MEALTRFHYEKQSCPRCLHEEERLVWDLIDVAADPDLKDRLLKKDLHTYNCEMCGELLTVDRPCLYLDRALSAAVFYHPGTAVPEEWKKALVAFTQGLKAGELDLADSSLRHLRVVHSINDLMEKVHVLSAGLDDRILSIVKLALRNRYREDEAIEFTDFYFLAASDAVFLFSVNTLEKGAYTLEIGTDVYLRAEQTLKDQLPPEPADWLLIDEDWAVAWLNEQA